MIDKYKKYRKPDKNIRRKENSIFIKKLAEEALRERNRYKNWRYDPQKD